VTAEDCRQSSKGWEMGSADWAQSLVSKKQTPGGSAAVRDGIEPVCRTLAVVGLRLVPVFRPLGFAFRRQQSSLTDPKFSLRTLGKCLRETAPTLRQTGPGVPMPGRRIPRTADRGRRTGVGVRKPWRLRSEPSRERPEDSGEGSADYIGGSGAWLQSSRGISQSTEPTKFSIDDIVDATVYRSGRRADVTDDKS
jgi:hypothetical protein